MYKTVIVDDEPIICEGLKKGVKWSDFGCEVAGTAANGEEGLKLMEKVRPDILITDISMNSMDGLTMIAAIRSEYPDMEVSILTGYRNFEYAQQAIKLGVTRFLLKPSRMAEITEAITAMTDNLKRNGNLGTVIIDNLWNMEEETDRYLYERFIKDRPQTEEDSRVRESGANGFIVKKALTWLYENYTQKVGLSEVAAECYVSSWHLSKLLNQYTGRGFFEIVNVIRIDHAKQLLTQTERKIQVIAEEVGFQDVAHFSRIFKGLEGVSPKEYRGSGGQVP